MRRPTAIVIGAGAGGVVTAAQLAQQGFDVQVIERNDYIGGRCSLLYKGGYRFDQGPSLVLMPELFRQAFGKLGTSMEAEGITMLKCEPNYCIWFSDQDHIELSSDMPRLKAQIERHEGPGSFYQFCAFQAEAGLQYKLAMQSVFRESFSTIWSMLNPSLVRAALHMRPWKSTYAQVSRFFQSEKMRRTWSFTSMYLGMSPFNAPASYTMLPYIEIADGIWYPEGGFQQVLQALSKVARRSGAKFLMGKSVAKVELSEKGDRAVGVRLESGQLLRADYVVVNADLVYAYNNLLPPSPYGQRLQKSSTSCSSISFYWGFDEKLPALRPHNVFLADAYQESFDAIFDGRSLPDDFCFYVNVPTRVDPTAAPDGKESVMVLVPIGHLGWMNDRADKSSEEHWQRLVTSIRDTVIGTIEARTGMKNLRSKIVQELFNTPITWEEKFNLDRGAILGLSHSFDNVLWLRPQPKHSSIRGLYFTGCSTHPGAGVPASLVSGRLTADQIVQDESAGGIDLVPRRLKLGTLCLILSLIAAGVSLFLRNPSNRSNFL